MCAVSSGTERNKDPVLFAQGAYHLMKGNINRRKKLYSEIINHVIFQELTE